MEKEFDILKQVAQIVDGCNIDIGQEEGLAPFERFGLPPPPPIPSVLTEARALLKPPRARVRREWASLRRALTEQNNPSYLTTLTILFNELNSANLRKKI